jgi:hypothetical protein
MLAQMLVLLQITFLNNVRKVGRLVLSRTSCFVVKPFSYYYWKVIISTIFSCLVATLRSAFSFHLITCRVASDMFRLIGWLGEKVK